jgi:hypothetical protein
MLKSSYLDRNKQSLLQMQAELMHSLWQIVDTILVLGKNMIDLFD